MTQRDLAPGKWVGRCARKRGRKTLQGAARCPSPVSPAPTERLKINTQAVMRTLMTGASLPCCLMLQHQLYPVDPGPWQCLEHPPIFISCPPLMVPHLCTTFLFPPSLWFNSFLLFFFCKLSGVLWALSQSFFPLGSLPGSLLWVRLFHCQLSQHQFFSSQYLTILLDPLALLLLVHVSPLVL